MPPPTTPEPPPHLRIARRSYASIADPSVSIYTMLHLAPHADLSQIEEALYQAQRWWNAQQSNPKYRRHANEALARLREAKEILLDPIRRQEYDRQNQHLQHTYKMQRWQPVGDLIDVLVDTHTCTYEQHLLLMRFAQKRGWNEREATDLLAEEYLRRNIHLLAPPQSPTQRETEPSISGTHMLIIGLMLCSLMCILLLPFYNLSRPAILLSFPLFNNLRLLMRAWMPHTPSASVNGWDWLVGIAVLGGSTITALSDLQTTSWLPLGLVSTALSWLSWLWLTLLHPPEKH